MNFTNPTGITGGTTYQGLLSGDVSGANNGGVHFNFTNPVQTFTYPGGTFALAVDNFTVSGTDVNAPITGFIQASGVPEPATWAMMLVGFGGIGMAMRRRRRPVLAQIA